MTGASDYITAAENALRELVSSILTAQFGREWIGQCGVTEGRLAIWKERQVEEGKRRAAVLEADLIYFSDLPDLTVIIQKHWELFKPALTNRKRFDVDLERLETLRVAIMHGRELLPHERAFAEGISREIRNKVTIHRTRKGSDEREYFPRMESAHDSLGNARTDSDVAVRTDVVLHSGDDVTFEVRVGIPTRCHSAPLGPRGPAEFVW